MNLSENDAVGGVVLVRDIRKKSREQPFIFWGGILATFFGICSILQTVTSIWSLVLAIKTDNPKGLALSSVILNSTSVVGFYMPLHTLYECVQDSPLYIMDKAFQKYEIA